MTFRIRSEMGRSVFGLVFCCEENCYYFLTNEDLLRHKAPICPIMGVTKIIQEGALLCRFVFVRVSSSSRFS